MIAFMLSISVNTNYNRMVLLFMKIVLILFFLLLTLSRLIFKKNKVETLYSFFAEHIFFINLFYYNLFRDAAAICCCRRLNCSKPENLINANQLNFQGKLTLFLFLLFLFRIY
jgi:hypothetical protein